MSLDREVISLFVGMGLFLAILGVTCAAIDAWIAPPRDVCCCGAEVSL